MKEKNTLQYNNLIQKNFNYGLGFLKVILAFCVVRSHIFNYNSTKNKILLYLLKKRGIHVPSFFIMSFYFMHKDLISANAKIYLRRIERLLIPYLFWPIIIFILNNYIINKFTQIKKYSFNNLKIQIFLGSSFMRQFWFQWNLIALTTIFFIIIFLSEKNHLFLIQIFALFAYFLQYSGYNKKFFDYLNYKNKYSLERFNTVIPFSSTGFTLASLKIINSIQNYRTKTLTFCIFIFFLLDRYSIFTYLSFEGYPGILYNARSICLIFIFSLFPSKQITNIRIKNIIKYMTNYTAGIYYLHITIILYFKYIIKPIRYGTLSGIFIIYLICYIISFFGFKICRKTKFRYLFS